MSWNCHPWMIWIKDHKGQVVPCPEQKHKRKRAGEIAKIRFKFAALKERVRKMYE